ncbi:MAG: HAD-IA family hydrolase [Pseudomonadales bacterium]|jgi:putative hydrolase of the HAD superfamily|nr:HAD-IA family hydrolase [Pseudomonadales bacterium]
MSDLQAILWDFGGVLTTSPFEAFARYEAERGLPRDFIRGINATNPTDNAWARFESSRIGIDEFDEAFREEARAQGHDVPGRDVLALLSGDVRPRMVAVLEQCKAHFRCACLTNNVKSGRGPGMATDEARASAVAEVMAKFDLVVESSVEGVRKPEPRAYEIVLERLGVTPDRMLFLDDLGINLKPAAQMGMTTIKVLSEEQAIADLAQATGLDFRL